MLSMWSPSAMRILHAEHQPLVLDALRSTYAQALALCPLLCQSSHGLPKVLRLSGSGACTAVLCN